MSNSNSSSNTQVDDNALASDYDSDTDSAQSLLAHGTDYQQQSLYNGTDIVPRPEPLADRERRKSFIREDEDPLQIDIPVSKKKKEIPGWLQLPNKHQLAILTIARLSEPLVQTSLRTYVFFQLKSFDKSLPDATIASQAGIMQGCFAAAQLCTAMLWGRASDKGGRKRVLLIGLSGTTISCIGFGLATTFWQALLFRMMAGALNGNVGVMRTMISEIVREKKFQSRAFLLLPMCSNIGSIIGPIVGGLLADPAKNYPGWFGGIKWLEKHPYAPPNFLSAIFLMSAWLWVFFGLDETHESFSHNTDYGREVTHRLLSVLGRFGRKRPSSSGRQSLSDEEEPLLTPIKPPKRVSPRYKNKLPFRSIFTYNVVATLICHALITGCNGTFNNMWYSFLSTDTYNHELHPTQPPYNPRFPLAFTGGLGMIPRSIGFSMAILGSIGITLQLFVYPIVNARIGTVRSWRIFLYCFPLVFFAAPFLSIIPSTTPPPSEKTGPLIWTAIPALLFLQVIGKTFAGPATTILINNCSPHPTVLGTIHGIGQTASSAAKTIGPAFGGWLYGFGLNHGVVGLSFWTLACVAVGSCVASNWVREGDGHEIRLEGDDEAEEEAEANNRALGFY